MKYKMISFLILLTFVSCSKKSDSIVPDLDHLLIVSDNEEALDLSMFLEPDVDIVPIETSDNALLGSIKKIVLYNEVYYILDDINKHIFAFDREGSFLRTIGKSGSGPQEEIYIHNFFVDNNRVYIQDLYGKKYNIYKTNGDFIETLKYEVHHLDAIIIENTLYFISNYFKPFQGGYFNLYGFDINNREIKGYISFDKNINEKKLAWTLNNYVTKLHNEALVIYPRNDTIYYVSENEVYPKYVIEFADGKPSESMKMMKGDNYFTTAMKNGLNLGINHLQNFENFILAMYIYKGSFYYLYVNKDNKNYLTGKGLIVSELGDLSFSIYFNTCDNEFLSYISADVLKNNWNYIYKHNNFENTEVKKQLDKVINKLSDTDNPVILRFALKKITEIIQTDYKQDS